MSQESAVETERVVVQTYVPKYQRNEWDGHAEDLDMNRSEFIRTMVQAGRQVYAEDTLDSLGIIDNDTENSADGGEPSAEKHDADSLVESVKALLDENDCLDWDELLTAVSGDIETRLEDALETLQAANQVKYSGRAGGYVLLEDTT